MGRRRLYAVMLALAAGAVHGADLAYDYVEPGVAACPPAPAPSQAAPPTVRRGTAVPGRVRVACGFDQGSYTLTLRATDPGARFEPPSFLVNFGRLVGDGAFVVRFATTGVHEVSVAISSNMGSPPVGGRFASGTPAVEVVDP